MSWAAWILAGLFALQGVLHIAVALRPRAAAGRRPFDAASRTGIAFMAAGLFAYPALDAVLGGAAAALSVFGLHPAPTVLFTLGCLLAPPARPALYAAVIPLATAPVLGVAGWMIGTPADIVLVPAAAAALLLRKGRADHDPL